MYFVGIDISKYKHDCFVTTETNCVIKENFSFNNNCKGFQQLLDLLKSFDNNQEIRIGFEATGHYHMNLMLFLEKNNYSFMELNPALVKRSIVATTLRKTKTDKLDAIGIAKYLKSVDYKPHPKQFYHKYALKSLSRRRTAIVNQRSFYMVQLTNVLDITFPEFKSFFNNKFSATSLFILNKYKTAEKIANMKDFDSLRKISRGKFSYPRFLKLKELAKESIGTDNELFTLQLQTFLNLYFHIDEQISLLEDKINDIIKELNPQFLSIKGIGSVTCAAIISEFGNISRFKSADAMVAFAGLDCSIIQSGTSEHYGKMVKHGSSHLRYHLMKAAEYVFMHEPIFTVYYYKKRNEGKSHRVTLNHVAKKLIRIIYKLETENIPFDRSKLR